MIDREHPLSVARQAKLLDISRGAVYYRPRPTSDADLALMRRIDELHLERPFMGARMLRRMLLREGVRVGRRHLGTLMLRMGIEALCPQPGTSQRNPQHKVYPYLLRKVAVGRANQVWALDTTYIRMARGYVYLTALVDVASRRVLTHKVAITLEACHARERSGFANSDTGIKGDGLAQLGEDFAHTRMWTGPRESQDLPGPGRASSRPLGAEASKSLADWRRAVEIAAVPRGLLPRPAPARCAWPRTSNAPHLCHW